MSSRFKIPKMPSTVNKTIRFPQSVVDQVEAALQGTDCKVYEDGSEFPIGKGVVLHESDKEDRKSVV